MKTLKNGKKQAIKFDRKCKNAKHRCHQQTYYKLRNVAGVIQYLLKAVNHTANSGGLQ